MTTTREEAERRLWRMMNSALAVDALFFPLGIKLTPGQLRDRDAAFRAWRKAVDKSRKPD
jgi:hypothetical protein